MLLVRGINSTISQALLKHVDGRDTVCAIPRDGPVPAYADRYVFCAGLLRAKTLAEQTPEEIAESYAVNCTDIIRTCDALFAYNERARVCVIGSESAYTWSYDGAYAGAKAALHSYVETKRLPCPGQQLVCVSPSIIEDAGMTTRRLDVDRLDKRRAAHPKKRFLTSAEIARVVYFLLYEDSGYICNHVVRVNGGEHTA